MTQSRSLIKNSNRRLFDTERRAFVRLDQLRAMIREGASVQVRERRGARDVTRTVLLQAILDQEESGESIFSQQFLLQLIHAGSLASAAEIAGYLEESIRLFASSREKSSSGAARSGEAVAHSQT